MDDLILNAISRSLRTILFNHIALIFMFYLLFQACGANRPRWGVIVTVIELRMAITTWILEVVQTFHGQESWYPLLLELTGLFHSILGISLLRYVNGHLGKKLFATIWTETLTVGCVMGAWILAYWGTGEIYLMSGQPLRFRDALMIAYYLPLCVLCAKALKPVLRFYRNYHFEYPRLMLWMGLLILFSRIYINTYVALPQGTYRLTADLLFCNVTVMLLAIVLMKKARLQKQLYTEQQRSVETHLELLREQAAWVADSRAQLEEQIAVMESLRQREQAALVGSYLAELKAQYNAFLETIRGKDLLVDALLCYKETLCRQQGISTEFSLEQYNRGEVEEQEVIVLLLLLFDTAIQSSQKNETPGRITLSMALLKGQLLLEMHYSGKQKFTKEGIRPILARHGGVFLQERTKTGWRVEILLEATSVPE